MGVSIKAKYDLEPLFKKIRVMDNAVPEEAAVTVAQAAELGAEYARYYLDQGPKAYTKWGWFRFARGRGGSPGRNDTGLMIRSLTIFGFKFDGLVSSMKFGWLAPRKYFYAQEFGTNKILGVNSLKDASIKVGNEMPRLIKNMKQRVYRRANKK